MGNTKRESPVVRVNSRHCGESKSSGSTLPVTRPWMDGKVLRERVFTLSLREEVAWAESRLGLNTRSAPPQKTHRKPDTHLRTQHKRAHTQCLTHSLMRARWHSAQHKRERDTRLCTCVGAGFSLMCLSDPAEGRFLSFLVFPPVRLWRSTILSRMTTATSS